MSATSEALKAQLHHTASTMGATYFGVADLAAVRDTAVAQGGDSLAEYPVGVSAGIVLADGVVDLLHEHTNVNIASLYSHHIYSFVRERLERLAAVLAFQIEQSGYRAIPVPQGRPYNEANMTGFVSHKLVAHLAGLGWIGKNCLLTTRLHGPRVRWITVLTDAPLAAAGGKVIAESENPCKNCSLCVELCPAQAFTGVPFNVAEHVDARFHREKCRQYLNDRNAKYGSRTYGTPQASCGVCVYVCPFGWSFKRKKDSPRVTPSLLRSRLAGYRRT